MQNAERVVSCDELAATALQGRVASGESIAQGISDTSRAPADTDRWLLPEGTWLNARSGGQRAFMQWPERQSVKS